MFIYISGAAGERVLIYFPVDKAPSFESDRERLRLKEEIGRRLSPAMFLEPRAYDWDSLVEMAPTILSMDVLAAIRWICTADYVFPFWLLETLWYLVSNKEDLPLRQRN